jgi:DNA repair exonuclease SbcCD ATPase subunit
MMQVNEIQQRFTQIESTIHQAAERCRHMLSMPMDLKDSIQQLDQKAAQAHDFMDSAQDENEMAQWVDDLEELGDRAKDACARAGDIDSQLRDAIMQAHSELSNLKHQLH